LEDKGGKLHFNKAAAATFVLTFYPRESTLR